MWMRTAVPAILPILIDHSIGGLSELGEAMAERAG
jgi:hypothetical protein